MDRDIPVSSVSCGSTRTSVYSLWSKARPETKQNTIISPIIHDELLSAQMVSVPDPTEIIQLIQDKYNFPSPHDNKHKPLTGNEWEEMDRVSGSEYF